MFHPKCKVINREWKRNSEREGDTERETGIERETERESEREREGVGWKVRKCSLEENKTKNQIRLGKRRQRKRDKRNRGEESKVECI